DGHQRRFVDHQEVGIFIQRDELLGCLLFFEGCPPQENAVLTPHSLTGPQASTVGAERAGQDDRTGAGAARVAQLRLNEHVATHALRLWRYAKHPENGARRDARRALCAGFVGLGLAGHVAGYRPRKRWISVPTPRSVKISRSSACWTRPSMMCAFSTWSLTACKAHLTFGIIPPVITPDSINGSTSRARSDSIKLPSASMTPCTSVIKRSFAARSTLAMLPATTSALTLREFSSRSMAMGAITGITLFAISSCTSLEFTDSIWPTRPRSIRFGSCSPLALTSTSERRLSNKQESSRPESPTACPPCLPIKLTIEEFTLPHNTISTTSMVSSSVTRMPPANLDCMPTRSSILLICGPPPCTTTTRIPT